MRQPPIRQTRSEKGLQASFMRLRPFERVVSVASVVLVVAAVFLFQSYRQAQASNEKLQKQLAGVERGIASLKKDYDVDALQQQKDQLTKAIQGPDAPWAKNFDSLDVDNLITSSAVQNKVDVLRLNLGKDSKTKIGNVEYQVELRQVQVRGDLANIVRFIDQIQRGQFPSLRLNNIRVGLDKGNWTGTLDVQLLYVGD